MTPVESGARIAALVQAVSLFIDVSYPADLDSEARMWCRLSKPGEEYGEFQDAFRGWIGENPRKGVTHTFDDVMGELLDIAGAALGAAEHLDGNRGRCVRLLLDHLEHKVGRLVTVPHV